jgi:hypothetical protein
MPLSSSLIAPRPPVGTSGHRRVVFTSNAPPANRPVNQLVDDGRVIVRTRQHLAIGEHLAIGVTIAA